MRKIYFTIVIMTLFVYNVSSQTYKVKTELQSQFIDITGLFGVDEPANVSQFEYFNNGFGLDLYHGFSLQHFGKTIQSILTPSYLFKLDSLGKFSIKTKVEIANLQTAGGGFIRPGIHFIYKPNKSNILNIGTWTFNDMRDKAEYPNRLNGYTFLLSYTHKYEFPKWGLSEEVRILYVDIQDNLKIAGLFANLQLNYKPWKAFIGVNAVYSFYRSDNKNELFGNLVLGKEF